jgi:hypothetical protein
VFVTSKFFHPSLIFAGKAISNTYNYSGYECIFRLGWKGVALKNALAYAVTMEEHALKKCKKLFEYLQFLLLRDI